jgi:tRNA(fMet)-specific endonuclease VapC
LHGSDRRPSTNDLPIGPYDLLSAAQAFRHDLLLITPKVGEFVREKGLRWEDWTRVS